MEDTITILIVFLVIGAVAFFLIRARRKNPNPGYQPTRFEFLFRRNGEIQIPWVTGALTTFLVLSYFTIGASRDPSALVLKGMQEKHLFHNTLYAALGFCKNDMKAPPCFAHYEEIQDLLNRTDGNENLYPHDLVTFSSGLDIDMAWIKANPSLTQHPGVAMLTRDLDDLKEITTRAHAETDVTLSRDNFSLRTLFLSQVSHANMNHLMSNILALVLFGCLVEGWLGSLLYLLTYVVGGTIAMAVYIKLFAGINAHVLGASGNISSIVAAYGFYKIKLGSEQLRNSSGPLLAQALYLFYYLFGSDVKGIAQGQQGVAFEVHLLGAFIGVIILLAAGTPPIGYKSSRSIAPDNVKVA
jgi:membrane associated rhomboid family serine protease